jgi:cytoplasmic iron level regulating protein YaaA (DUF328/UPF0246 family)
MIHILSPAKTLDYESELPYDKATVPEQLAASGKLINKLRNYSKPKLKSLMSISTDLAELNLQRYRQWEGREAIDKDSRQAIFAFKGDVYQGLQAYDLSQADLEYAQSHLRILSGLYGVLKPLDVIEPYRLEMGTELKVGRRKNLYDFWRDEPVKMLNEALKGHEEKVLLNLASKEYFKAVNTKKLKAEIVSPEFKDAKNGEYKIISFFAKKARGLMSRFIIKNRISRVEDLQAFDLEGYRYNHEMSSPGQPVFTREENQS